MIRDTDLYEVKDGLPLLRGPVSGIELFTAVKQVITTDDRCFNTAEYISPPGGSLSAVQEPECGWVACIGGWMAILTRGTLTPDRLASEANGFGYGPGDVAADVLKMEFRDIDDLFSAGMKSEHRSLPVAYARIAEFIYRHEGYLMYLQVRPDDGQRALMKRRGNLALDTRP